MKILKSIVSIDEDFITLGRLLKHVNVISSGGMAKWYLSEHVVFVDNEKEDRRGRKIYPGMTVEIPDEGVFLIQSNDSSEESLS